MKTALVLGGGWAGCGAAWQLSRRGVRVTLVEKRASLGGRAGSSFFPRWGRELDTGQHLFLGAYQQSLALLRDLGTVDKIHFEGRLKVCFLNSHGARIFQASPLPGPLGLAGGLLRFGLLTPGEKWKALSFGIKARQGLAAPSSLAGLTARTWLEQCGQPPALLEKFWEPLCLAVFNAASSQAPADLFARVMAQGFLKGGRESALGMARVPLSQLLQPMADLVTLRLGKGAASLTRDSVTLEDGQVLRADAVVLALPPWQAARVCGAALAKKLGLDQAAKIPASAIVTVQFKNARRFLPAPSCAFSLEGFGPFHWAFELDQPGWHSFVASAASQLARQSPDKILATLKRQLVAQVPGFDPGGVSDALVLKEARATPLFQAGLPRLQQKTVVPGLALCGDWTDTDLPATIEGAVVSGVLAAGALA